MADQEQKTELREVVHPRGLWMGSHYKPGTTAPVPVELIEDLETRNPPVIAAKKARRFIPQPEVPYVPPPDEDMHDDEGTPVGPQHTPDKAVEAVGLEPRPSMSDFAQEPPTQSQPRRASTKKSSRSGKGRGK